MVNLSCLGMGILYLLPKTIKYEGSVTNSFRLKRIKLGLALNGLIPKSSLRLGRSSFKLKSVIVHS